MPTPSTFTNWLSQPELTTEKDVEELKSVLTDFPYFLPARYKEAAALHQDKAYSPNLLRKLRLYSCNWILLQEYLSRAGANTGIPNRTGNDEGSLVKSIVTETETDGPARHPATLEEGAVSANEAEKVSLPDTEEELIVDEEDLTLELDEEALEKIFEEDEMNAGQKPEPVTESADDALMKEQPREPHSTDKPGYTESKEEGLIQPLYTDDYFLHQGIQVSDEMPEQEQAPETADKSLMVVMSFSEWLMHFKKKKEREQEEEKDQRALKTMWQKEKLAAALEEENEEIPENVFQMAVNSITREEDLISESLAEILVKQQKYDKAIEMYKKLSLRNPQKSTYFARRIEEILKETDS